MLRPIDAIGSQYHTCQYALIHRICEIMQQDAAEQLKLDREKQQFDQEKGIERRCYELFMTYLG